MPENKYLKTSFDFPDKLTIRARDTFTRLVFEYSQKYGDTVSAVIYNGIIFGAAINAGLLVNWKCESVQTLTETDLENLDSDITEWAGPIIEKWYKEKRHIPKVSFLRRLTTAFAGLRPHRPT